MPEKIAQEIGFKTVEKTDTRYFYEKGTIKFVVFTGTWEGKPAVLKLHLLAPASDEGGAILAFSKQSKSATVRAPHVLDYAPWESAKGYGYAVMEQITTPSIFTPPFATPEQMAKFTAFYQEYRSRAITKPWLQDTQREDSLSFTKRRMEEWRQRSVAKGRLRPTDYVSRLKRFYQIADRLFPEVPMVFSNGHLTPKDVRVMPDNTFVITENSFWTYRPQWYDASFVIWSCLLGIRQNEYGFESLKQYVEDWIQAFQKLPVAQTDPWFDKHLRLILLERTMGAILVDLGAHDSWDDPANAQYFQHLLDLHLQLFDYLADKLERE
jgi:hypothetical protein